MTSLSSVDDRAPVENVLVVEDHGATRKLLFEALVGAAPGRRVHAARNAKEALKAVNENVVDVALVDLRLPDRPGVELIRELTDREPGIPCIALTVCDDAQTVLATIEAGAVGYLLKDEPSHRREEALVRAVLGEAVLSPRPARHLVNRVGRSRVPASPKLSPRELDLVLCFSDGLSYGDCAERLGLSLGTVQDYVKRLYRKLGMQSKAELVAWAVRTGVVK